MAAASSALYRPLNDGQCLCTLSLTGTALQTSIPSRTLPGWRLQPVLPVCKTARQPPHSSMAKRCSACVSRPCLSTKLAVEAASNKWQPSTEVPLWLTVTP